MKLTNKQKTIIQKSLKLNEDFFDDFDSNNLIDDTVDDSVSDPDYTYHIHFIIYTYPFIKDDYRNGECVYYFEEPKYKSIVESAFLSMKKALDYILQASSLVTDYSKPKFCTLNDKIISIFPFMNNEPSPQLYVDKGEGDLGSRVYKEVFNKSISLEMTLNLSDKKNRANVKKLLYSFYKLVFIYNNLIKKVNTNLLDTAPVTFGYFRNNPLVKMGLIELISAKNQLRRYSPYMTDILLTNPEEHKKLHSDGKSGFQLLL